MELPEGIPRGDIKPDSENKTAEGMHASSRRQGEPTLSQPKGSGGEQQ